MTEIKLNLDNLTEDERKTLMALAEKGNKTSKVWKPKDREGYWYIDGCANIRHNTSPLDSVDERLYSIGNCFRTQEEAEEAVERLKVQTKLKRLSVEAGEDENPWDLECEHWAIIYNTRSHIIGYKLTDIFRDDCTYFPSKESLKAAIEEIGKDNVKKYILGVKE